MSWCQVMNTISLVVDRSGRMICPLPWVLYAAWKFSANLRPHDCAVTIIAIAQSTWVSSSQRSPSMPIWFVVLSAVIGIRRAEIPQVQRTKKWRLLYYNNFRPTSIIRRKYIDFTCKMLYVITLFKRRYVITLFNRRNGNYYKFWL